MVGGWKERSPVRKCRGGRRSFVLQPKIVLLDPSQELTNRVGFGFSSDIFAVDQPGHIGVPQHTMATRHLSVLCNLVGNYKGVNILSWEPSGVS